MIRVNASFCHWCLGGKKKQCAIQVRNLSGEMTLSPVSCSSCLLSHFISWLLLLSPVSYSCLQSHLLSPPISRLLSPVFPLLFYMSSVAYFILPSPISYFIRAGLTCLRYVFRARVTSLVPALRLSWPHHVFRIQMHSVDAMGEDTTVLKKHSWASLLLKVTFVKH